MKFAEEVHEAMSQVHVLWMGWLVDEMGKECGIITLYGCCFCFDVNIAVSSFDIAVLT